LKLTAKKGSTNMSESSLANTPSKSFKFVSLTSLTSRDAA
jgi:hypothetical protein